MQYDLVIKNGLVIDSDSDNQEIRTICVRNGVIVPAEPPYEARTIIDAHGLLVTPGLIDFHTHVFPQATPDGFCADSGLLPQGVTFTVDAGSSGAYTLRAFSQMAAASTVHMLAFLDIWHSGMTQHQIVDAEALDYSALEQAVSDFPHLVVGLKLRFGKPFLARHDISTLDAVLAMGESLGLPVAVHCTDAPVSLDIICNKLRPGDILVHCYAGTGNTILDTKGRILPAVLHARQRGVIMDASNGRMNWNFAVAEPAFEQGFAPDIISTDLTINTLYRDPVWGLPYIMSKYLMLGMSLGDIVRACTSAPARVLGREGVVGTLMPGAKADIAIFALSPRKVEFSDTAGEKRLGTSLLEPRATVRGGRLAYRAPGAG